jgi:hypothetical protein
MQFDNGTHRHGREAFQRANRRAPLDRAGNASLLARVVAHVSKHRRKRVFPENPFKRPFMIPFGNEIQISGDILGKRAGKNAGRLFLEFPRLVPLRQPSTQRVCFGGEIPEHPAGAAVQADAARSAQFGAQLRLVSSSGH